MPNDQNLEIIDLNDWTLVSERAVSKSCISADKTKLLKFVAPHEGQREELEKEQLHSNRIYSLGIPTPRVYGVVQTEGGLPGIIYQNIPEKESLARAITNHPENYQEYLQKYARIMEIIHSTECDVSEFSYIGDEVMQIARDIPVLTDIHLKKIEAFLDSVPYTTTCLHGDAHLGNVITSPSGDYAIDIDAFSYGNPLFDEAFMFYFLMLIEDEGRENVMHFSQEIAQQCWDYWCEEIKGIIAPEEKLAYEETLRPYAFCQCVKHAAGKPKAYDNVLMFMDDCRLF